MIASAQRAIIWLCSNQLEMAINATTPTITISSFLTCRGLKSGFEPYCLTQPWHIIKLTRVISIPTTLSENATLQPYLAASHGVASMEKNEPMLTDI
ncbi:hypothetical protein D3C80_2037110 [compost metagenome]